MSSAKLLPLIVALWLWAMASSLAAEDNADGDAIAAIRRRGGEVILGAEAYDGQVVAVDLLIAEFGIAIDFGINTWPRFAIDFVF